MTTKHDRGGRLFKASGVVDAPVGNVSRLLLTVRTGRIGPDNAWLLWARGDMDGASLTGGPQRFVARADHERMSIDVDAGLPIGADPAQGRGAEPPHDRRIAGRRSNSLR